MQADGIVFVDADDTLWENFRYFQKVLDEFAALMASQGVARDAALAKLHEVEDRHILRYGYGAGPFLRSVVETFHLLAPGASHATRDHVAHFAKHAEAAIRSHPIDLLAGVEDGIPAIAATRRIVVLTKGQEDEQVGKVDRSGLRKWLTDVCVLREKDTAAYANTALAFGVVPSRCWMVGNSPSSDVNPALAAGFRAIHVPHPAPWHRDVGHVDRGALVVKSFAEVPALVAPRRAS
jgi:putative hydrolase of the HAD superfamily